MVIHIFSTEKMRKKVRKIMRKIFYKNKLFRSNSEKLYNFTIKIGVTPKKRLTIVSFIYGNVGKILSISSVSKYLKETGRSSDPETIANYVKYLEEALIIRRARRYDVKGKKLLETLDKYYLGDHSLQYAIRNIRSDKVPGILENIVYLELIRRGYTVYVGKTDGDREIDFVAEKDGAKVYVQVCTEFSSEKTFSREFSPLKEIKDSYPKYVVTLDRFWQADENGVRGIHLKDFLLKKEF